MFKFWLVALMFFLSGCGERHCIKPENLSNLHEKLDIASTQQKWVDSGIEISGKVRVTEIDIVPSKLNFCPNQYVDFTVENNINALNQKDYDEVKVIDSQIDSLKTAQEFLQSTHGIIHPEVKLRDINRCFTSKGIEINGKVLKGEDFDKLVNSKIFKINFSQDNIDKLIEGCRINKEKLLENLGSNIVLPFELKKDDKISFSIVENKMCKKNNEDGDERYIKIDENCNEGETAYFAKVLNREECYKDNGMDICPNKYMVGDAKWWNGDAKWLNGKEYWNSDLSKLEEGKGEITRIINSIKQGQNIDCSKLSNSNKAGKIDTYLLNFACKKVCYYSGNNCVEIESSTIDDGNVANNLGMALPNSNEISDKARELIKDILEKQDIKTYIPSLKITMAGENFEHVQGGIQTNHGYKIKKDHLTGEKLTFNLGDGSGKGGYNIRVTKHHNLEKSLYIHVSDSVPDHNPGENPKDVPVDISKIHDFEYMESVRGVLNQKVGKKAGKIYYGIRDHGCDYKKNEGEFSINVTTKEPHTKTFSTIYNFFDKGVKTAFFGSSYKDADAIHSENSPTKSLYQSFIASNKTGTMRSTIIALLVLYIVLYTLYYFFGLSHLSIYEFLIISVKIGIITQLLKDDSWNFFYNNAFSLFVNAPTQLIGDIANFRGTGSNVFEFLDLPLNRFLSSHSVLLIVSLIFSGPLGIVAFCLVIWGLITVLLSIFNALFSFVTSIAIIALLLSLAPIFIICVLFKYTRQMFQKWVGYLARFAIHPVILLIFMSLISQVMDYIVYSVFDFEVCTTCIFDINLVIFQPCIIYGYASKYTPNITAMMAFVILGHAMKALVEASSNISDALCGGYYVSSEPGKQYQQSLLGIVGLDQESIQRRKREAGGGGGASPSSGATNQRPQIPQIPSGK